jgi:probable phosphoglycerate mutase
VTTTVFFVRHAAHGLLGHVLAGRMAGVRLGEEGLRQADRLATRLARESVAAVCSSPLERALETAAPIARRLERDVQVAEALNEIDLGEWSGRSFDALDGDPQWRNWNAARSLTRAPKGETMLEVQARAVGFVERMRRAWPDSGVVLVSHADVIKAGLAYYLGLPLDSHARFEISPASLSALAVGDWGARVLVMNEVQT